MLKHIIYIDQLPYIVIQLGWWAKWEYVQYILNVPKIVCKHRAILFHSIPHGCRRAKETVWSSLWFLWVWLYCSYLRLTNVSFSFKKPHVYFNTTRFNNLMTIHYAVLRTRGFSVIWLFINSRSFSFTSPTQYLIPAMISNNNGLKRVGNYTRTCVTLLFSLSETALLKTVVQLIPSQPKA